MIYKKSLGIDPGTKGALVGLDPITFDVTIQSSFPMVSGKLPDYDELSKIINSINPSEYIVYLEDVHAKFGSSAKSTFNFGYNAGFIYALLKSNGFIVEFVQPKVWQKNVWATRDKVLSSSGRADPKPTSLMACKRLFPTSDFRDTFRPTERVKKLHEGLVDASLIAYYGACKLNNKK